MPEGLYAELTANGPMNPELMSAPEKSALEVYNMKAPWAGHGSSIEYRNMVEEESESDEAE